MTPASRLHAAATRLRALAGSATPGPWWVHRDQAEVVWYGNEAETYYLDEHAQEIDDDSRWDKWAETTGQLSHGDLRRAEDAEFIAAMAPPVALAVADWLDLAASHVPYPEGGMGFVDGEGYTSIDPACGACGTPDEYAVPWPCATYKAALAVADAINEGDH